MDAKILTRDNTYISQTYVTSELYKVFEALMAAGMKKDFAPLIDENRVKESLDQMVHEGLIRFIRDKETDELLGAFAYGFTEDWWTREPMLVEIFIISLSPHYAGVGRVAVQYMEKFNVGMIETGAFLADNSKVVENLYMNKMGFTASYPCFYKIKKG